MSALPPVPYTILPTGDVTPAMRQWMLAMLTDSIGYDNAISYLQQGNPSNNALVDGSFQVTQGVTTINLTLAPQYTPIDMWAAWVSGGAITSATAQTTSFAQSTTRGGILINYTLTGAGQLSLRQRIESLRAQAFATRASANRTITSSFSALMFQDSGAAVNAAIVIRTPTAADNFASLTTVYTSPAFSLPSGVVTTVYFDNIALGNVTNGIELEMQLPVGAVTGKRWFVSDVQLVPVAIHPTFVPRTFNEELPLVQRYFQKSFPYATAPAQNVANISGALLHVLTNAGAVVSVQQFRTQVPMRANPTMTFFNPSNTNANWFNRSLVVDSGAATVFALDTNSPIVQQQQVAADAVGHQCYVHWTADARL